ncbi:hypothetical protein [Flavobacterium reichenbachii]|uniref:Lipoprotein n=1 Tax=Flavobacterium reichenbachii TaxID=362418 RepID=A0A085ZPD0_9FLAO|nr:hypothetical protein [Flavobacterium reichenbachii]KFF06294.1 hypothetical protein IW19_12475 [Flavobacterium reichenbachii]OXB17490.1 hypothetical protein B0A68_04135 [Flavobacterium reichenbachii]
MTLKLKILSIAAILLLLFSCGKSNEKKKDAVIEKDSIPKVLADALEIASQNSGKNKFQNKYKTSDNVEVELNLDNHFTKNAAYLIIHRSDEGGILIDIYLKEGNKFKKILSHDESPITYQNDTIRDINGDGLKDFVVNWYGANGMNLKAYSTVYLLKQDKKTFSKRFDFINPTFSPEEKIIRGVCYGQSGETDLYKEKWNGETTENVEFVSYEKNKNGKKTGKITITKENSNDGKKVIKRLNSVPEEYTKIYGYDWFTGKGYQ